MSKVIRELMRRHARPYQRISGQPVHPLVYRPNPGEAPPFMVLPPAATSDKTYYDLDPPATDGLPPVPGQRPAKKPPKGVEA